MKAKIATLAKRIIKTPLLSFNTEQVSSTQIYLKPENLQPFGSYKLRGIVSVIKNLPANILMQGLSAASAGNMAQAMAYAAQQLAIPCRVFVPDTAPTTKIAMVQKLGATIISLPYQKVWQMVMATNDIAPGFIHPALNANLTSGYGTIAEEIITDLPDADAVVIPFGVGGLSLGIARVMRRTKPSTHIYLAEPETAAPFHASLSAGRAVAIKREKSFIDAIGTPEVLPAVYEELKNLIEDSLVMPIPAIKNAFQSLLYNKKILCEGAAACSFAAAQHLAKSKQYKKIVCILSGGNIDSDIISELINH